MIHAIYILYILMMIPLSTPISIALFTKTKVIQSNHLLLKCNLKTPSALFTYAQSNKLVDFRFTMAIGIFVSLLFGAAIALYFWIRSKSTYLERRGFLSKEPSFPQGNLKGVGTKFHISHVLKTFYDEFKTKAPVHGLYQFFLKPTYVVTDLDVIKEILIKDFDNFRNRGIYHSENDVLSNHLFSIEDEPWKKMRNNLVSLF